MSDSQWKYDLQHEMFTAHTDALSFYEAERTTVVVGSPRAQTLFQLCQITFNKRHGSIYAQFTYFGKGRGMAAVYRARLDSPSQVISLGEVGFLASTPVKYSHPPDGNAHFSQDGRVVSKVRRRSFRLDGPQGHLFELHVYRPERFSQLRPGGERSKRLYLPWLFAKDMPGAVALSVEWRRKEELERLASEGNRGPLMMLPRRRDGERFKAMLVGQPTGFPLREHVMVVNVGPAKEIEDQEETAMIFFGGWDESNRGTRPREAEEFLTFMYPAGSAQDLGGVERLLDWPGWGGDDQPSPAGAE